MLVIVPLLPPPSSTSPSSSSDPPSLAEYSDPVTLFFSQSAEGSLSTSHLPLSPLLSPFLFSSFTLYLSVPHILPFVFPSILPLLPCYPLFFPSSLFPSSSSLLLSILPFSPLLLSSSPSLPPPRPPQPIPLSLFPPKLVKDVLCFDVLLPRPLPGLILTLVDSPWLRAIPLSGFSEAFTFLRWPFLPFLPRSRHHSWPPLFMDAGPLLRRLPVKLAFSRARDGSRNIYWLLTSLAALIRRCVPLSTSPSVLVLVLFLCA